MSATLHTHYTRTAQIYLVYTLPTFNLQQYFKTSKQFPYPATISKEGPSADPLLPIANRNFAEYTCHQQWQFVVAKVKDSQP
jgi:hypothetical protein